jgi:hypothetical protein
VVGRSARLLRESGWAVEFEVSYSHYGERGSIDVLAWHAPSRTLLVVEAKTILASVEELLRRHDQKVRLGPLVAAERFGWRATAVGRLLVVLDERTNRRRVERRAEVLDSAYPGRGWQVRSWLGRPAGSMAGLLFLPLTSRARGSQGSDSRGGPVRVRRPVSRACDPVAVTPGDSPKPSRR